MEEMYGVNFVYHGKLDDVVKANPKTKEQIERVYMILYNEFTDIANELYAKWNDEFDKQYPGFDGYSEEYNKFLKERQLVIADEVNRSYAPLEIWSLVSFKLGIGSENNAILYIPEFGTFETGDYVEFFLKK